MKIQRLLAKVRERMCYLLYKGGNSITANKVIVVQDMKGWNLKGKERYAD